MEISFSQNINRYDATFEQTLSGFEATFHQEVDDSEVTFHQEVTEMQVSIVTETIVFETTFAALGEQGLQGKSAYQEWILLGNVGNEETFIKSIGAVYEDIHLTVTQDNQTVFNVFNSSEKSNLFVNDMSYFEDRSYEIKDVNGAWKLTWLNEFQLKTTDYLIFRKIK